MGSGQESGWSLGLGPAPPSSLGLGGFQKPWPWTRDPLDWHLVWGSLKGGWGPPETKLRALEPSLFSPLPACGESCGFLSLRGPSTSEPVWAAVNPGCHIACTQICPLLDPPWVHWQVWGSSLGGSWAAGPAGLHQLLPWCLLSACRPDRARLAALGLQGSCRACTCQVLPGPQPHGVLTFSEARPRDPVDLGQPPALSLSSDSTLVWTVFVGVHHCEGAL